MGGLLLHRSSEGWYMYILNRPYVARNKRHINQLLIISLTIHTFNNTLRTRVHCILYYYIVFVYYS